ncbi:MAG: hypothetical protein H6512_10715 [Acidimicrobiia bacterium]|nr:hypothetical protein [Acidimicrobiia bacterium]
MAKTASTPTRVSADVFEAAAAVGRLEHRTATEQVNYWARIGMQIERSGTLAHRKVLDVAAGRSQFSSCPIMTGKSLMHWLMQRSPNVLQRHTRAVGPGRRQTNRFDR